jgi:DNA-binding LacI/PurR family transcriptional regulator
MASLLGILSVEQYEGFFAERYFREIITVASQAATPHACRVQIMPPVPAQADPPAVCANLAAQGLDAALIIAPDEAFLTLLAEVLRALPSIIISAPRLDIPFSYVNSDNYGAMRAIVAHLASLGRRRIRLLQPPEPSGDFLERARGYHDAIGALGLEPALGAIDYPIDSTAVEQVVLAGAPDALIAADDQEALVLLGQLQRRGVRVPEDIALVGFDDEDFAAETLPALTTVSQPLGEMARRATLYLLDQLAGVDRGLYQDILPNRLIVRESCGAHVGGKTPN